MTTMSAPSGIPLIATPSLIFQRLRPSWWRSLIGLAALFVLAVSSPSAKAQSTILDCSCLATQAVLYTSNCSGIVPDLCLVASNCYTPSIAPAPGFTCNQTPPAGSSVTGNTPITFTLIENGTGISNICNVTYWLGFTTNRFRLICPTNQIVPCNTTNWTFYGPAGWTNVPLCCTNPVTIFGPFITTNWPFITAQWIGQACGVVDFCQESIIFGGTPIGCPCLDLICPSNILVQTCLNSTAGTGFTNVIYPLPVVSNTCIGTITNLVCTPPSGSPFPIGTNTVTCIVQDNLGNSATCSFDIIVLGDIDPPLINCAPVQTVQCGSGWMPVPPPAFDACCGTNIFVMMQSIFTNVSGPCLETVFIDWHFTDCNGNSTNCSEVINITDTTPPVIICNSNQIVQCGGGAIGTGWTPIPPTAFDACCPTPPVVSLVNIFTNSSTPCNEILTLTWMAEDCCTNIAYCTEVVTITDTNPPVINCLPFKQIECGSGPNWFGDFPTAFDGCCGTNVTVSLINVVTNFWSPCFSDYNLMWTATDCCTNTSLVCTQRLQIVDTLPPNVICGTNKTVLCGTPWTFDPPIAIDDCCTNPPTIVVTSTTTNGVCPVDIIRTWQITDCCGHTTNCTQVVMVVDNVPPIITCNSNQTVQCGSAWTFTTPTAIDNCCTNTSGAPGVTITIANLTTNSFGSCSEVITALWQATDCCGNKSFCTETVTVIDTQPPIITCNSNQTYQCGATPGGMLVPPAAFDMCCGTNVTVSLFNAVTNGSIPCNEIITLTWQALDCCTNAAYCTEVVTITDTNPPVITCASNKVVECGSAWAFDPPTVFDACCGTNVTLTVLSNNTIFSSTCVSIYEQFWMATDCCTNNSAVCSQRVVVQDTTPPAVNCPPGFTIPCGTTWSFTPPTAVDACCGTNVTITVFNTLTNGLGCPTVVTRNWMIQDCCGNVTNCSQTVTIVDNIPPVITCAPNQVVQCGTPWTFNPPTATDNCCTNTSGTGGVSVSIGNISTNNLGPCQDLLTVIWKATDCCGNSSFCTNTVTVVDNLPPVINCNTNYTLQCGNPLIVPTATDLCCPTPTVTLLSATTNIINPCTKILTLAWRATDCCTNTATCVETVTITDTTPPTVTCAPNKTIQCGTPIVFDPPTAFDTCCGSNVTITVQFTSPPFGTPCAQTTTRQWLISDCCSNTVTCAQTITIVDTIPPVITCAPSFSVLPNTPWSFTPPTAVDACAGTNNSIVVMITVTNVTGPCQVTYTRMWTAVDPCGNASAPCTQSVTTSVAPPPNDLCPNAILIVVNAPYLCGSNICATPSVPGTLIPVPCGASANTPDVWYTVTAVCTGPLTVDTCAPCAPHPTFDTVLSAYTYTNNCNTLVQVQPSNPNIACNDDLCGLRSIITFPAIAGQSYRIRVSGFNGSIGWFSIRATQSTTAPPNDLCINATVIPSNSLPATICGTTLCGATPTPPGNLFPAPCGGSANTADVWYRFTPQCSGIIQINTCGTCPPAGTFDTVLSVYTGICPGPLNQVPGACNDDSGPLGPCPWTLQSFVQFNATAGVTYYIRVSGWSGATGNFRLNLNQIITPPANDLCPSATTVGNGTFAWNNCGANTDGPGNPCGLQNDVWFNYTPACSGTVMLNTCGSSINTALAVYSGPCGGLSLISCNDNAGAGSCAGSQQSYLTFTATAGVTYRIRVGGVGGAQGGGVLNIVGPNPPATTCGAGPVSNWRLFVVTGAGNGTPWAWSVSSPCCANLYNGNTPGVVGSSLAVATAFANSINTQCPGTALAFNFWGTTYLVIGTRCGPTAPVTLGVGPAFTPANSLCIVGGLSLSTFGACSFNPDIFAVELTGRDDNHNDRDDYIDIASGDSADVNGNLIPDEVETCAAPEITAKPETQVVEVGQDITLGVSVSGTAPFSYQWLLNGQPLPGATGSTLHINPVTTSDLGAYSVTVSNACGTLEGTAADIFVQPTYLPVITDANLADGWFRFMVETKLGYSYVIEYKNDLADPAWTTLTNTPGIGAPQFIYDSAPPRDKRFYRVIQRPAGP